MNTKLEKSLKMAYANKLALNIEKTNFVLFHSPTWKFTDPIIIRFEREKSAMKNFLRELQVNFCGAWSPPPPPPPLNRSVSNLAQRLLSIPYFNIFLASRCIRMPFWQFYSLESFYKNRKILSRLRSSPARTVLIQLKQLATSCTATQVIPCDKYE